MTENLLLSYRKLMERTKEIIVFISTKAIMEWDMETKMPPKGIHLRSEQLALLSGMQHKMETAPEIGALLNAIENHKDHDTLDTVQKRNVYLIRRTMMNRRSFPKHSSKKWQNSMP